MNENDRLLEFGDPPGRNVAIADFGPAGGPEPGVQSDRSIDPPWSPSVYRFDSLRAVLLVHPEVHLENYALAKAKFEEYGAEHLRPEPLVTGADLIGMGYEPGPQFSKILAVLEDAQLEGRIVSQEEAMEMVRARFPREEA